MSGLLADTHAVVWYLLDSPRLSAPAREALERAETAGEPVYVASISLVEVRYLVEHGRLPEAAFERMVIAFRDARAALTLAPLDLAVAEVLARVPRAAVPDRPDRIIAATALHLQVPLVSRDARLRRLSLTSVW